ncbi:MAG: PAS domain S-box protein [bacterium]|nr:PAS domain S-box protein [bacterium]
MSPQSVGTRGMGPDTLLVRPEVRLFNQLRWMIILRLVAITSVVLPYFLLQLADSSRSLTFDLLFRGAGVTYAASLVYLILLALRSPAANAQAYIQFVGDLVLISALVFYVGGTSSPFTILYLIVITEASVFLRRRAGIHVANLAWLLYAAIALVTAQGWVSAPGGQVLPEISALRLVYYLIIHLIGFYAVAFMTAHLAANVARAERALERKGERLAELRVAYRDVIESIPSGLMTTDQGGLVTSANIASQEILRKSSEHLLGEPVYEMGLFSKQAWNELKNDANRRQRTRLDTSYQVGDDEISIGYTLSPLSGGDGPLAGFILIFQDLSEWRRLQEEIRLKERMAAVGQMASGLAHEIGNPLAAISGSVQMLSSGVPEASPKRRLLDIILKESQRLDRTIKNFLQFARPKEAASVRFDVAALVSENVALLRNSDEVDPGHEIELALEPDSVHLVGDPDQISQIFWNLARNSLRAMKDGGKLHISGSLVDGNYQLDFLDTGCGMTAEEKSRMFHPFRSYFDSGTGIGMAIVYRIVEEHNGQVHVDSHPDQGTRIRVDLPGAVAASQPVPMEA